MIFQRLHGREAYPGNGIGLALCKRIVEYHGGEMHLDTSHTGGVQDLLHPAARAGRGPGLRYYHHQQHRRDSGMTDLHSIEVLLVEDDPGDELMTREAFEDNKIRNRLHVARDGEEALDFLYRRGEHAAAPRVDLILLDLNLPKYDGRQILERVKSDPGPGAHPGSHPDHVLLRGGHPAQLQAARQRVRDQAGGRQPVHRRGPAG